MDTNSFVGPRSVSFKNHPSHLPLRNSLASVVSALESLPAWAGVLATNLLDARIVFRRPPPSALGGEVVDESVPLRDRDLDRIRHWFEVALAAQLSKQNVVDAVRIVADQHAFHPVREYLTGLSWDGRPRLELWLESFAAVRVSRLLSRLGYERRRRASRPRAYHYVRVDVPPSQRPSSPEQTSELPFAAHQHGSHR
jgi:hypothetical protein